MALMLIILCVLTMIVTLIHSYFMYCGALCLRLSHFIILVIAHSFCVVELLIYNLHMYRTLYQAGMYKMLGNRTVV